MSQSNLANQIVFRQLLHLTIATALQRQGINSTSTTERTVFFIDPTGSFSAELLLSLLVDKAAGYIHQGGFVYSRNDDSTDTDRGSAKSRRREQVKELLDQVAVLRVFDFEGLLEAIGEVSNALVRAKGSGPLPRKSEGQGLQKQVEAGRSKGYTQDDPEQDSDSFVVADSDDDVDAMTGLMPQTQSTEPSGMPRDPAEPLQQISDQAYRKPEAKPGALVVIAGVHTVAGPLLKKHYVRGQALFAHLFRRLRSLSLTHQTTILLENCTAFSSADEAGKSDEEGMSAFADIRCRPALGRAFAWSIDVSLMLTRLRLNTTIAILECIHDRTGGRYGRWVALDMGRKDEDEDGKANVTRAKA